MPTDIVSHERDAELRSEDGDEQGRAAARHYDEATERYIESGRVEEAAKRAREALDGPEGDDLREAEFATRATQPDAREVENDPRRTLRSRT
jgi:hypothetical protein